MTRTSKTFGNVALVLVLCTMTGMAMAQENCANGVDDDGDGLIDLNDPDCTCYTVAFDTLLGDFEDMSCCPEIWTGPFGDGIECLEGWSSANDASPDYMHECDYTGGDVVPSVPLPIPSGQGAIGFVTLDTLDVWSEFIGICMPSIMLAGETYTVEMYIGFNAELIYSSSSPFEVAIFGTSSCANYPASTAGCVEALAEWDELGTQSVTGADGSWSFTTFTFTPAQDIAAIAIGGKCVELNGILEYHFVDDVKIFGNFGGDGIMVDDIIATGDCVTGVQVSTTEITGATYQWYLNGVAIAGATSSVYDVPTGGDGEYIVVVDNGTGCGESDPLSVTVQTNVLDIQGTVTDVDCFGSASGSVDLDLPADNPPFAIQWGTGQVTEDITDLLPGSYSVTVTDDNGCSGVQTFVISQPDDVLMVLLVNIAQPVGAGTTGSAEVSTTGGTPDYMYSWDNGETSAVATLEPGIHFVTITDANGCEEILQVTIYEPFVVTSISTPVTCFSDCDGTVELVVQGGLPDYTYEWDDGSVTPINADLCPGIYFVTISDNAGTQIIESFEVDSPDEIIIVGDVTDTVCATSTGSIMLNVSGGSPGYSYIWSNGETVENIVDLVLDNYSVTVTDINGCTRTETFFIDFLDQIIITGEVTQESCGGGGDGAININIEFGITPFTYIWSNGLENDNIDGLISGVYDITVTDNFGCTASESFVVSQGGSLDVAVLSVDASCPGISDGTISVIVSGGTPPYIYNWDNGATTPDLNDLAPGDYMLTIEDNGGCTWIDIFTIGAGTGIDVIETVQNAACWGGNDGQIMLAVSNGTPPYGFSWSNGSITKDLTDLTSGGYSVTVTDASGCMVEKTMTISSPAKIELSGMTSSASCSGVQDGEVEASASGGVGPFLYLWSTGDITQQLSDLGPGDYGVTVTDANACTADSTFTIDALEDVQTTGNITSASCNGGSDGAIDVTTTGGNTPYQFLWSTGQTTEDIQNLIAGLYTLSVTDDNGCLQVSQFQVFGAGTLTVTEQIMGINCFGDQNGAISLTVSGGAEPYKYQWSNGMNSMSISGLTPGNYTVTITDAADCEFQAEYTIEAVEELTYIFDQESVKCNGDMTGYIRVIAAGGTEPFDYQWSNGQNTDSIQNLSAGDYTLTITDVNGCTVENQFNITEPPPLAISVVSISNPTMVGEFGAAEIAVSGGVGPYDINWENGETGTIATQLEIGFTLVTVIDANGCFTALSIEIKIEAFSVNYTIQNVYCYGMCTGIINLEIAGGLPPYQIEWSDGQTDTSASNLCAGIYSVKVTDGNGSEVEITSIDITSPPKFALDAEVLGTTCIENNDGQATITPTGGAPPYTYSWSTGSTQSSLTNLTPGQYSATVTDLNNCENTIDIEIPGIEPLDVTVTSSDIDCFSPAGTIHIEGQNLFNYTYLINGEIANAIGDSLVTGLSQGTYLLEYQVNSTCIVTIDEIEIQEVSNFTIEVNPEFVELTAGASVTILLNINGKIGDHTISWSAEDPVECIQEDSVGHCLQISLTPRSDQEVSVLVLDDVGCEELANVQILVNGDNQIFIPNVFSPNDDSVNDIFKPYSADAGSIIKNVRIFSRWGEEVYSKSNINMIDFEGWDGTYKDQYVQPGVYVYTFEIVNSGGEKEVLFGDITVLR